MAAGAARERAGDVVVVGGGVIGLASAWRLAQRGAAVAVVDPDPGGGRVGRGGRDAGAGHRGPHGRGGAAGGSTGRPGRGGRRFAAEVEAAAGDAIGYRADGTLVVALDADDRAVLDDLAARHRAHGPDGRARCVAARSARLEPGLAPGRAGRAARRRRAVGRPAGPGRRAAGRGGNGRGRRRRGGGGRAGRDGAASGRRVTGVALATRRRHGGSTPRTVVLAAGCRSATLPGCRRRPGPPVRPGEGADPHAAASRRATRWSPAPCGAWSAGPASTSSPGRTGAWSSAPRSRSAGWDTRPTAGGAYELLPRRAGPGPGPRRRRAAWRRAPACGRGRPTTCPWSGRARVDGLVVATGHHRNGILLTPITAEAVAAAVAGRAGARRGGGLRPRRFAAGAGPWRSDGGTPAPSDCRSTATERSGRAPRVADLVADCSGLEPRGIAVAVDGEVVTRRTWGERPLAAGERGRDPVDRAGRLTAMAEPAATAAGCGAPHGVCVDDPDRRPARDRRRVVPVAADPGHRRRPQPRRARARRSSASGTELTTVALRRVDPAAPGSLFDVLRRTGIRPAAQHRRLLHGPRRGAHGPARAARRSRPTG